MKHYRFKAFAVLTIFIAALVGLNSPVRANDLIMIRVENSFPETMTLLQAAIEKQGYKVSRVQRVDVGLTKTGHKTDRYRIVFFGKAEEIIHLSKQYPELIPYLPLKIVIFAEGDDTLILSNNLNNLKDFYRNPKLHRKFQKWNKDVREILHQIQLASMK